MNGFLAAVTCAAAALALAACTSTPQASAARDAEAKQFISQPGSATIYVFRSDLPTDIGNVTDSVLWIDGRLVGATLARSYFRVNVRAGRRVLHGDGVDQGRLALDTAAGEIYFVSLNVRSGTSQFALVKPDVGKSEILRCCSLLETWTPGQRPLLF